MSETPYTAEQVLLILAEMPERITALTGDLSPEQLRQCPEPEEWSLNEILAHLRACADVFGRSMMTIIVEDTPSIRAISPRTYIHGTDYPDLEFRPSFAAFAAQRADLLEILEPLPLASWSRTATITGAGRAYGRTLLDFGDRMARHERGHLRQIAKTAAAVRV